MLRDYQIELINKVKKSWETGHKNPCIVAPCGSGKTLIASELAKKTTDKGNRVVFIVHRKELCEQTENTFRQYGVNMNLCDVYMVQTLARRKIKEPRLIIIDENHHVYANSYKKILESYPMSFAVGLTATPVRLDGSGLGKVNDDLIIGPTVSELIKRKHLSPFKYYSHISADTSKLQIKRGEFIAEEVNKMMNQEYIFGNAIENYKKYNCRKTIVYCSSIENSIKTSECFRNSGISAIHVDSKTPKKLRENIMNDFKKGNIHVLCNVDLVSEGFDVPDCDSCILLRPTMSLTLHMQQSMRAMRYMQNKMAIIIDQVENYKRHGLPDTYHEWKLDYKKKKKNKTENLRICDNCFSVYNQKTIYCKECNDWDMRQAHCDKCGKKQQYGHGTCINCGNKLEKGIIKTEMEQKNGNFHEIVSFMFKSYKDCKSINELKQIQKANNYKPGWVYYKAKELKLL